MEWNAKQKELAKAKEAGGGGDNKNDEFADFDPNADLSKMSLPEQLQWNKKRMAYVAKQKEEAANKAAGGGGGGDEKDDEFKDFDPNADITKMSLPE